MPTLYVSWVPDRDLVTVGGILADSGFSLHYVKRTPCQVLKARGKVVCVATPAIFNGFCGRQGAWYRGSDRAGQHLLVSAESLPGSIDRYLAVRVMETDFQPEIVPNEAQVRDLVDSPEYQEGKPADWELLGLKDAVMQKLFFTLLGIWKKGDTLKKHWPRQCAVHANFLSQTYTTELDGSPVPYSVSNSAGICSSCVETFALISPGIRKLVAPCPGSICFGGSRKDVYVDVEPL